MVNHFKDGIVLHFKVLDVVYVLEHYSYESGERWVITDIDMHTDEDYLCTLLGISNTNMGCEQKHFSYDIKEHEEQLNTQEKQLFSILYT